MAAPLVLFCDFDGTISQHDLVVSICEHFCPPVWKQIVKEILGKRKTVKDGVAEMFALIPSSKKEEVIKYARKTMKARAGFQELLDFCELNGVQFTVCSGGVDFFIEPLMAPYRRQIAKIYSIPADFSGPTITLRHTMACETEGTCKVKAMDEFPGAIRILIGDSITDLHGARHANVVFARARLKQYLDEEAVKYTPFETFHEVVQALKNFGGHSMSESEKILIDCGRQFYERKWMWGTAGNLSLRLKSDPLEIAITPSGLNKGHLQASDLMTIQDGITPSHPRGLVPSAETVIHQAIYRAIPEANAAFHVHPMYSTIVSSRFGHPTEVRTLHVEWFEMMKGLGVGEEESAEVVILPNWQYVTVIARDLTQVVQKEKAAGRKMLPIVLIYNHGLTGWGQTPDQARNHLEIMEYVCQYIYLKQLGGISLPEDKAHGGV